MGSGRDNQVVVAENLAAGQANLILFRIDDLDTGKDHINATGQVVPAGLDDVASGVDPKGHEQVAGLVVVFTIAINYGDLPLVQIQM